MIYHQKLHPYLTDKWRKIPIISTLKYIFFPSWKIVICSKSQEPVKHIGLAAGVANVDTKLQIYPMEWDQSSKAQSFQWDHQALKHSLLPVFGQPHLMPQVMQDQFPGRTEQNWVQPKEGRGLGAHGRYHWKKKTKTKQEISWFVFVVEWKSSTTEQIQCLALNYLISRRQKSVNHI